MNAGRLIRPGLDHATPWPWSTPTAAPGLVACPLMAAGGMYSEPAVLQEIYRLAYERAQAAARPSRYELALRACWN